MRKYAILFSRVAGKELRHLPNEIVKRVIDKTKELESEPRPQGCKKLVGEKEVCGGSGLEITALSIQ